MKRPAHALLLTLIVGLPLLGLAQDKQTSSAQVGGGQAPSSLASVRLTSSALASATLAGNAPPASCSSRSPMVIFEDNRDGEARQTPVWRLESDTAFFFSAGMTIDADGSPNAYNADNSGLDDLANAGEPGHWEGIVAGEDGEPLVQGPNDPYPGYYVSCTSLADRTKKRFDPTRYVDASKIPYVVLPGGLARDAGARLGDFAMVFNERTGKYSGAIFADVGTFGEGSIALADNLGIWPNARQGGRRAGILYLVFPGTGNGQPRTTEEINDEAEKAFQSWGGSERIGSCVRDQIPDFSPTPVVTKEPAANQAVLAN